MNDIKNTKGNERWEQFDDVLKQVIDKEVFVLGFDMGYEEGKTDAVAEATKIIEES